MFGTNRENGRERDGCMPPYATHKPPHVTSKCPHTHVASKCHKSNVANGKSHAPRHLQQQLLLKLGRFELIFKLKRLSLGCNEVLLARAFLKSRDRGRRVRCEERCVWGAVCVGGAVCEVALSAPLALRLRFFEVGYPERQALHLGRMSVTR